MGRVRAVLLGLVVFTSLALVADLILLEHTAGFSQWLPLAVLGLMTASAVWVALRPEPVSLRIFQALMIAAFVTGSVGIWLHYRSNVEFELEMYPTMGGWQLVWQSLKGAVPALAPGAMAQLGLLGLVFTLSHPALRRPRREGRPSTETGEDR